MSNRSHFRYSARCYDRQLDSGPQNEERTSVHRLRAVVILFPSQARLAAVVLLTASFQVHGFDLLDAYQLALTRDPAYASARAAWAAAQEKLPQGRALLLPSVTASANTNFN